jgi:phosphate transport system substrate-binding protein
MHGFRQESCNRPADGADLKLISALNCSLAGIKVLKPKPFSKQRAAMKKKLPSERLDRTKLNLSGIVGLLSLGVLIAGCSPKKAENVVIRGSNTIGEELAPGLIAEYKKEHPGVAFDLEFKGTSYGLGALMVERADLAAASRELTTNELALAKDRDIAFNDYVIGSYSVAVVANANNPIGNLTTNQVREIFTGEIQNWKELGGPDAPIHAYIRDPISGTYIGFQELAMDKKPYALHLKTFTNDTQIVQAVTQDANAIGYTSIEAAKKPGVKAISIGGIAPTADSVNKNQYPYARVLRFYTTKAKESSVARDFVQFVQSARGQEILSRLGYVGKASER